MRTSIEMVQSAKIREAASDIVKRLDGFPYSEAVFALRLARQALGDCAEVKAGASPKGSQTS